MQNGLYSIHVNLLDGRSGKGSGVVVTDQVIHVYTVRSDKIVRFEGFSEKAEALKAVGLEE